MTKITPNVHKYQITNINQRDPQSGQQAAQAIPKPENEAQVRKFRRLIEKANVFFKWSRIKRPTNILSIKPAQPIDAKPLKGISNEALVARLTDINISLSHIREKTTNPDAAQQIEVGSIMIDEYIRRLLLIVNTNENPNKNAFTLEDKGMV